MSVKRAGMRSVGRIVVAGAYFWGYGKFVVFAFGAIVVELSAQKIDVAGLRVDCRVALIRDRLLQEWDKVKARKNKGGCFVGGNVVRGKVLPTPRLDSRLSELSTG